MKINIAHDAQKHAAEQRQSARKLADKIEFGEPLSAMERGFAAAIMRGAADTIQAPTRQGPAAKLPQGDDAAIEYAILINHHRMAKLPAREAIAEKYGVSIEAVRKYLKKNGREEKALAFTSNNQS